MSRMSGTARIISAWGLRLALLVAIASPLMYSIGGFQDGVDKITRLESLIERHSNALNAPRNPNRYVQFERFLQPIAGNGDEAGDTLQARLSQVLRSGDARLLDLQKLPPITEHDGLIGLRAKAEIEGDLQAILARLSALEQQLPHLAISELRLSPRGRIERPDRSMRLSLEMVQWQEQGS